MALKIMALKNMALKKMLDLKRRHEKVGPPYAIKIGGPVPFIEILAENLGYRRPV